MLNIAVGIINFLKIYHILHVYQRLWRKIETLYDMVTRRKDLFLVVVSCLRQIYYPEKNEIEGCEFMSLTFSSCSLVTPDVMDELVKLITCEPDEDVEDKVKYK